MLTPFGTDLALQNMINNRVCHHLMDFKPTVLSTLNVKCGVWFDIVGKIRNVNLFASVSWFRSSKCIQQTVILTLSLTNTSFLVTVQIFFTVWRRKNNSQFLLHVLAVSCGLKWNMWSKRQKNDVKLFSVEFGSKLCEHFSTLWTHHWLFFRCPFSSPHYNSCPTFHTDTGFHWFKSALYSNLQRPEACSLASFSCSSVTVNGEHFQILLMVCSYSFKRWVMDCYTPKRNAAQGRFSGQSNPEDRQALT